MEETAKHMGPHSHGLSFHQYADDSHIYGSCPPAATSNLLTDISLAMHSVSNWMRSNRLQLHAEKTEVMWCASARRQSLLPRCPIMVGGASIEPVSIVCDWASTSTVILVPPSIRFHLRRTVVKQPRQLYHLRCHVTNDCLRSLVVSLIHSRLDYGTFVFVGLPAYLQRRLQTLLNATARLVFRLHRYDIIWRPLDTALAASARTCQLLTDAHGIPIVERCGATISESTRSVIKPARSSPSAVVIHAAAAHPRVPSVQPAVVRFLLQPPFSGTLCQTTCSLHRLSLPSDNS